jgi:hypothetical protein
MPQLDLRPASAVASSAPPQASTAHGGGVMFDADDLSGGPDLETESDWQKPARPVSVAPVAPPREAAGSSGPRGLPEPDPQEVLAFAAYDDAPAAWWEAPVYAYRVKMRQAVLGRQLAERRGLAAKAADAEEEALAAFGDRIKAKVRELPAYADVSRAAETAEQILRKEDSVLAAAMDAQAVKLAAFDRRIAPLEHELAGARADVAQLKPVFDRAEAMRKRAEIEARNATSRTDAKGVEAERAAREQLTRATSSATQAGERLAAVRKNASEIQQRITDAKNERAALQAEFKRRGNQQAAGVSVARKGYRKAIADLADKALADTGTFGAEHASDREQIEKLRDALAACARDVILCDKAMGAYDREVFKQGATMVAVVLGALMVLLVVVFYYAAIGGSAPAATVPAPHPAPSE